MTEQLVDEFKQQIIYRLNESTRMLHLALEPIDEANIWERPTKNSNSIGSLILHLCGNITQYAIASLGNEKDQRNRDKEFDSKEGFTKSELLNKLNNVLTNAKKTINLSSTSELLRKREVQGFNFSGIGIIIHVTEHYSYHTGQIAFWVKQLTEKQSLGFYDGHDLNIKNKD